MLTIKKENNVAVESNPMNLAHLFIYDSLSYPLLQSQKSIQLRGANENVKSIYISKWEIQMIDATKVAQKNL